MAERQALEELEVLRTAIARGGATQEDLQRFDALTTKLDWPAGADLGTESVVTDGAAPAAQASQAAAPLGWLGKELTKLDCSVQLRLTHVPLALVHAFSEKEDPIATVAVENSAPKPRRLRVRSWVEGYSAESVVTVELGPNTGSKADAVNPPRLAHLANVPILPTFFQERLDIHAHPVRATLHIEVLELGDGPGGRVEEHRTLRLWLLPRTTTVLWQTDPASGQMRNLTKHLASWVTPDAPEVMEALRESAKHITGNQIVSYQAESTQVEAQVKAIFTLLKERQLAYVNSTVATGTSSTFVQRIRLPADSLRTRSANCIDGSALYASLFEAASLRSAIVLIPGHAFVAWRSTRRVVGGAVVYGEWNFLETTMTLSESFERAREAGTATYKQNDARGTATILDVQELRAAGYLPIG